MPYNCLPHYRGMRTFPSGAIANVKSAVIALFCAICSKSRGAKSLYEIMAHVASNPACGSDTRQQSSLVVSHRVNRVGIRDLWKKASFVLA